MPVTLYKRGKVWHYRGTVQGRRLRGSTGTADKEGAKQIAAEREAREYRRDTRRPSEGLTFAQAAHLYRDAGKSVRFLDIVEDHWRDAPVAQITPGAVKQAAQTLYPYAGPATRNRQVIAVTQAVINHAADIGLCHRISVRRLTVPKREKTPATWEWVSAHAEAADTPEMAAFAIFMFCTGARVSEATSLDWSNVDLAGARALVRSTKTGIERWAHLPPPCVTALANIEGRTGRVFGFWSRDAPKAGWNRAIRKAGIEPLTFHACRHGFATAALQAGIDPVTVAKLGGWKTPAHVFATYGHALDDQTVVNRIIGKPKKASRTAN